MKKVIILLSTYNGEKYILEQLDSLVNQTYKNIEILIRDDGSKDNTVSIIKKYMLNHKNIKLIKGKNIGFVNSFFELIKKAKGEYYSFCDQDDIWHLDKIEKAVSLLNKENNNIPLLYASNYDYYDENMTFIAHANKSKYTPSFSNALFENISTGNTMVFNNKARDLVLDTDLDDIVFHDWWLYMVCVAFGKVIYDSNSTIKYRRHSNNVTTVKQDFFGIFIFRLKQYVFNNKFWNDLNKQHILFYNMFFDKLNNKDKKILKLFIDKKSFLSQVKKTFYFVNYRNSLIQEIMIRMIFLIGKI